MNYELNQVRAALPSHFAQVRAALPSRSAKCSYEIMSLCRLLCFCLLLYQVHCTKGDLEKKKKSDGGTEEETSCL